MDQMSTQMELESASNRAQIVGQRGISKLSPWLVCGYRYRIFRPIVRRLIDRYEGGAVHSRTLRIILRKYFGVDAGLYSYGPCLKPGFLPAGTKIGRYCSFAAEISIFRRNHPKDRLSTHPFFFNHNMGIFSADTTHSIAENGLTIGHDVWIGSRAMILPNCRTIGDGAIVGAGAVITKDVPPFGIVVGNPAKLIGHRFSADLVSEIVRSNWWAKSIEELGPSLESFSRSLTPAMITPLKNKTE